MTVFSFRTPESSKNLLLRNKKDVLDQVLRAFSTVLDLVKECSSVVLKDSGFLNKKLRKEEFLNSSDFR
jgi:hypothetical protein